MFCCFRPGSYHAGKLAAQAEKSKLAEAVNENPAATRVATKSNDGTAFQGKELEDSAYEEKGEQRSSKQTLAVPEAETMVSLR